MAALPGRVQVQIGGPSPFVKKGKKRNAFYLFVTDNMKKSRQDEAKKGQGPPNEDSAEFKARFDWLSFELSATWTGMTDEEKQTYKDRAEAYNKGGGRARAVNANNGQGQGGARAANHGQGQGGHEHAGGSQDHKKEEEEEDFFD